MFIYVLKLENNKYYVGKTNNIDFRLEQHFNYGGSKWTKIHKPIEVVEMVPDCDAFDEDKYTIMYMDKHGIDNVRGGSYTTTILSNDQISNISKQLKTANDQCFKCGETGHFAKSHHNTRKKNICFRCGRHGHLASGCYARSHINGDIMYSCYRVNCNEETDIYGDPTRSNIIDKITKYFGFG